MTWWHSIDALSRAKFWLGYATLVGVLITTMYTVVSLRLDALRAKPRVISQHQRDILMSRLRKTPGGFILVAALAGDEERYNLSKQIFEVLKEAGWDARFVGMNLFPINPKGLAVFIRGPDSLPSYFVELVGAFQEAGLPLQPTIDGNEAPNLARIVVGQKQ